MDFNDWVQLCVTVVSAIGVVVPLIITVVKYVKALCSEKQWNELLKLVFDLCVEAESAYEKGTEKKQWAMSMIKELASSTGYKLEEGSMDKISTAIDEFIAAANALNAEKENSESEVPVKTTRVLLEEN